MGLVAWGQGWAIKDRFGDVMDTVKYRGGRQITAMLTLRSSNECPGGQCSEFCSSSQNRGQTRTQTDPERYRQTERPSDMSAAWSMDTQAGAVLLHDASRQYRP